MMQQDAQRFRFGAPWLILRTTSGNRPGIWFFILLVLAFCQGTQQGYAQGEWNNWYFGVHAALDFNTVPPSGLPNSAMNVAWSPVSVSDSLGQLLFYSDGFTIYNHNHQMMSNGYMLFGAGGVFAFKEPGQDSIFYIFTVKSYGTPVITYGLYYSLINMKLKK